jgi:hypothetical protein
MDQHPRAAEAKLIMDVCKDPIHYACRVIAELEEELDKAKRKAGVSKREEYLEEQLEEANRLLSARPTRVHADGDVGPRNKTKVISILRSEISSLKLTIAFLTLENRNLRNHDTTRETPQTETSDALVAKQ